MSNSTPFTRQFKEDCAALKARLEVQMIHLEDGLSLCGRCIMGSNVGYITKVGQRTYSIRWLDGEITTQLRPDLDEEEAFAEAAE